MKGCQPSIILVAEDDPDDRLLCKEAFKYGGIGSQVLFFEDGEELMTYLRRPLGGMHHRPDIILLDIKMPRKNGWEALQELKEDPRLKNIPVYILTTSKDEDDVRRSQDLGAEGFFTKPVSFEGLISIIHEIFTLWRNTVVGCV